MPRSNEPLRVAHFADLHYSPKHLEDVDRAFKHAIHVATDQECELAVIAGDSFDAGMGIHEPAFRTFVRRVVDLASDMPVVVLQGTFSHDRLGALEVLREIPTMHPILVADQPGVWALSGTYSFTSIEAHNREQIITADKDGHLLAVIAALPSLNKADRAIQDEGAKAYVRRLMGEFAGLLHGIAAPSILVSHGTVTGCTTESGYAMVSPDHEFDAETLFNAGTQAVMLGHIHRHQGWSDGPHRHIAYPGSITRLVHGHHDPVGFLVWEITSEFCTYQFHHAPAPELLEITFSGPPNLEELEALAAKATDADRVRIRWDVDEELAHSIDKAAMRALFAHCASLKLEGSVNPITSVRAEGIGRAQTLEQKLRAWLETTGDAGRLDTLASRLAWLESADPERIAKEILEGADEEMKEAA